MFTSKWTSSCTIICKIVLAFKANNNYCNDIQLDLFKKNMLCNFKDQLLFSTKQTLYIDFRKTNVKIKIDVKLT